MVPENRVSKPQTYRHLHRVEKAMSRKPHLTHFLDDEERELVESIEAEDYEPSAHTGFAGANAGGSAEYSQRTG